MPDIDVTELLTDPDFAQTVQVIRRTQIVDGTGRGGNSEETFSIVAVVTAVEGDMVRQAEAEYATNAIMVHSITRLRGVTPGSIPDIVLWRGGNYIVKRSNDWSDFGAGFTCAVCELTDVTAET